jgi:hypothetical protein
LFLVFPLSNGMWYVVCSQVNRVDSWLLVVKSQTANLTLGLSFAHNLCFRCSNESCKPILGIYASIAFQWYKELIKARSLTPAIALWRFGSPFGTPTPKMGVYLGVWGFTPSHFLTLPGVCDVTPSFLLARTFATPLPWSRAQS